MPTVFLVDDDPSVLKALSRLLRAKGYDVRGYASPQEFLAHHDARVCGCAVLDVAMPGLDGLALQQALTASGSQRPVIFITGKGDIPTSVRAMKAGAVDFLTKSPRSMVTVKHVAAAMNLSYQSWKQVQIRNGENTQSITARVQRFAGTHSEKIAVLELQTAVSRAKGFQLRSEPLVVEERLLSLAYPGDRLRVAGGRFVQYGEGNRFAGTALLEMYDGDDRLVLDHGASGAPVLDCAGRVVAVISNLFTSSIGFMSRTVRFTTAWGSPNVVSVPVQALSVSPAE